MPLALMLFLSLLKVSVVECQEVKSLKCESDSTLEVIIHLKDQPDLSILPSHFSKSEKITYLKKFAQTSQQPLLDYLLCFSDQIVEIKTYWIFNGLYLKATKRVIDDIARHQKVSFITRNDKIYLDKTENCDSDKRMAGYNIRIIKADSCWNEGFDGTGVIIGNIDSGVDTTHPALQGKWYPGGWYDAVNGLPGPYDDNGHGTFTMGIICGGDGNGPFPEDIGVAPGARFIVAKAFNSQGAAPYSAIHDCLQWFATKNAKILNNPYTQPEFDSLSLEFWNDLLNLRNLGVWPIFKVGTTTAPAPPSSVKTPGSYPILIAAGATDSLDNRMLWSCRGPAPNHSPWNDTLYWGRPDWNLIKPDIVAPGHNIKSAWPGGQYDVSNGTSWAAAHVTGALAILLQKDSTAAYETVYQTLLNYTDRPPQGGPYPNNEYGWGRLNIYSALHALGSEEISHKILSSILSISPNPFSKECNILIQHANNKEIYSLKIYDAKGAIVKLFKTKNNILPMRIVWDGTNDNRETVPSGIYFVELQQQNERFIRKIVYVK
ncbi:MAG: S8 family peptidase [candidate division WOR-3 bacterium]